VDGTGALVIASDVPRTVALRVRADVVEASFAGLSVALPWERYGNVHHVMDRVVGDGWAVTAYAYGGASAFGLAVVVSGEFASAAHDLHELTMTRWRRLVTWGSNVESTLTGRELPVLTAHGPRQFDAERGTVTALMMVLVGNPQMRARLSDPSTVGRLVSDLANGLVPLVYESGGIGRDSVDFIWALHQAGYVHRYGRPLTVTDLPPLSEVMRTTQELLERNPYRSGRQTDTALLEKLVRRHYYDVAPWPFRALVD